MTGTKPDMLNEQFKKDGCFNVDLLDDTKCAKSLGWKFVKRTTEEPKKGVCIAEVDMSPSPGKQQHFVVYRPTRGVIVDPWTGTERPKNTYPFVSFRIFDTSKPKEEKTVYAPKMSDPDDTGVNPVEAITQTSQPIVEPPVTPEIAPVTNETPEEDIIPVEPVKPYSGVEFNRHGEADSFDRLFDKIIKFLKTLWNRSK